MANITETCPHCGNIVEGRKIKSYTNKVTRQGAKSAVHMATGMGGMATGAAVGSAILPGVGTVVGGALGFIGSAMFNQKVNESIDKVGDKVEDELMVMDFEFSCPKCGHTWIHNEAETSNSYLIEHNDEDNDDDDTFSFHILDIKSDKGLAAIEGLIVSGSICTENDVLIKKSDGKELKATIVKIFDDDFNDGDFCEYVDSESSGCTLYLEGVRAWQIDKNDEIVEFDEFDQFDSTFRAYINDDFSEWKISELTSMLENDAENCSEDSVKAQYYCLSAVARIEYFLKEWLENSFKNYPGEKAQSQLQKLCLTDGFENIQIARNLFPDDKEYHFISGTICMLKDFWVDSCDDKEYFEETFGDLLELVENRENFMFNVEWLTGIYNSVYKTILGYCSNDNDRSEPTDSENEYMEELKEILADGEISPRERRLLDKIRIKLGISESRAAELEASLAAPQLTPEEQEYLNEYKEIISEGEISARDQRYLDKLKKTNGITDQRASEIEKMFN